jgi:hypothetical protein
MAACPVCIAAGHLILFRSILQAAREAWRIAERRQNSTPGGELPLHFAAVQQYLLGPISQAS